MRPLLNLCMIVKNEAASIEAVLEAAKPHIDSYTIVDTGSTDGTQDIIRRVMKDVPGALWNEPFVDFASARNRALEIAEGEPSLFQLVLSGDEFLRHGDKLRAYLEQHRDTNVDCHTVRVYVDTDKMSLHSPRILRTGSAWRFEGKVHEVLCNRVIDQAPVGSVPDAVIEHVVDDVEKRLASIWEVHVPLLREMLEENHDNERALIFLAQSYEQLMRYMQPHEVVSYGAEVMALYLRRLNLPFGTDRERNYIKFKYLETSRFTGVYSDEEILKRAEQLAKDDPKRPDVALLHAYAASRLLPAPRVYQLAEHAAHLAVEMFDVVHDSPVAGSTCWRAHLLAAASAKKIATKYATDDSGKPWTSIAAEHATAGIATGGPAEMFEQFTRPATLEIVTEDAAPPPTAA